MRLIIDIDEDYVKIINKNGARNYPEEVIKNGTPLPLYQIRNAPTIPNEYMRGYEAAEREYKKPHGKWIQKCEGYYDSLSCSVCGEFLPYSDEYCYRADYCPHCGAKMEVNNNG